MLFLGILAALIVGFSKTGVPGTGILMVPMMAAVFGSRLSVGATLPMLIVADIVAVAMYHRETAWEHLRKLAPWVFGGLFVGTFALDWLGQHKAQKDLMSILIGFIVLVMLTISLLRGRLGDRLLPTSKSGVAATGVLAGFTTMVANAAGPIMQIYLVATGMPRDRLMHTTAWYFFIFNLIKVPLLIAVTLQTPGAPLISRETLMFDLQMVPVILLGATIGRLTLPHIPQRAFTNVVLTLSAVGGLWLIVNPLLH
jgi:hypothetical protein